MDFLAGDAERRTAKLTKISSSWLGSKAVFGKRGSQGALPVMKNMRWYTHTWCLNRHYHFAMRSSAGSSRRDPTDDATKDYVDAYMTQCRSFGSRSTIFTKPFLKQTKEAEGGGGMGTGRESDSTRRVSTTRKMLLDITRRYTVEYLKDPERPIRRAALVEVLARRRAA